MDQINYIFLMFSPLLAVLFVCLCISFWSWYKEKEYMKTILECIAMNVFPEIIKQKTTEDGDVVTYFDNEKKILKTDKQKTKVKYGLITASSFLIINILQLFGAFLFLKTSSYCDETKDCFLVGGPINHPVNCESLKEKKETSAVVCYEIVFRLPTAAGLCYGIFKTCTVALTVATTLMMNTNLNPDKIVCDWCPTMTQVSFAKFIIIFLCVACTRLTMVFYKGPLHGLDWEEANAEFTVFFTFLITSVYVSVMPWEELMYFKRVKQKEEGSFAEREVCVATVVLASPQCVSESPQSDTHQ